MMYTFQEIQTLSLMNVLGNDRDNWHLTCITSTETEHHPKMGGQLGPLPAAGKKVTLPFQHSGKCMNQTHAMGGGAIGERGLP
jgi:hypothetical protein